MVFESNKGSGKRITKSPVGLQYTAGYSAASCDALNATVALGSIRGVMAPTSSRATAGGNALCVRPGPMTTRMLTPSPIWLGVTASSEL